MDYLVDEVREKHPKMAQRADSGSRAAAIRIFCLTCMGGQVSLVRSCTAPRCPLYNFRLGHFEDQNETDENSGTQVDHPRASA